ARWLAQPNLILHVMREVGKRIALRCPTFVGNFLIATGKRYRLEAQEADGLGIVEGKLNNASDLLVVDAVHDRRYGNDLNASVVQVVNGFELYIEQIADFSVRIGGIADSVELEIDIPQSGFSSL